MAPSVISSQLWQKQRNHIIIHGGRQLNQEKLYLLHMDLCGPMRVESINEKKYILVIVDDYSRTYNGTEFVNQTLQEFYENVSIAHQTNVARTPQQNIVVEIQNRTPVEAARIMLIFLKALLFLWAEAINTACYTQNRCLIRLRYNKTPYELMHDKKPDLSFLHVFGSLCYPTNDSEDLGKLNAKADIADSLASEQFSLGLGLQSMTPATSSLGLTKDHPLANMIGNPSRLVSTRKQLETDAMWCYFDAFLTSIEPKNFKEAMLESLWIEAMSRQMNLVGYSRTRLDWFLKDSGKRRQSTLRNNFHRLLELRPSVSSGGGRIGEPTGRVGGRTGDQDGQGGDQGIEAYGGIDKVPDSSMVIAQQLQDLLPTIITQVGNRASNIQGDVRSANIKKMESVQDMSGCGANQKVKYTAGLFIDKALTWWKTQVQTRGQEVAVGITWEDFRLARLVPHLVTPENKRIERYIDGLALQNRAMVVATEPTTIQSDVLKAEMLTDEAIRNGSLRKNTKKRGNGGELSRDGNVRDDNKRSRTGRAFATITNPVRKEYTGAYFECGGTDHYKAACPRLNRALRQGGNGQNILMVIEGGQGRGNNGNQARGGAFMIGAEEAR
ncbi:retrovirus-related pol polyprotein from transposon TNT 1-94 [Tanacetum coccineum]